MKIKEIIDWLDEFAPFDLAERKWDNSGLQLGGPNHEVSKVLLCLDVNRQSVEYALQNRCGLILSHHPMFFGTLQCIDWETDRGQFLAQLFQHRIAVLSAHTNLDAAREGVNRVLSELLSLARPTLLHRTAHRPHRKLIVYVPRTHEEQVRDAMFANGAGEIGAYSHCGFFTEGRGTFLPGAGTDPFIGRPGTLETVQEVKIETVVPEANVERVLHAMLAAHPYEEPAYDLFLLQNVGDSFGYGYVGDLEKETELYDFASWVSKRLECRSLRYAGDERRKIRRVAVCGGSGADFIQDAVRAGADVFVTGDVRHHDVQSALEQGMSMIDAGHFDTEKHILKKLQDLLKKRTDLIVDCYLENQYALNFVAPKIVEKNVQGEDRRE